MVFGDKPCHCLKSIKSKAAGLDVIKEIEERSGLFKISLKGFSFEFLLIGGSSELPGLIIKGKL